MQKDFKGVRPEMGDARLFDQRSSGTHITSIALHIRRITVLAAKLVATGNVPARDLYPR